MHNLNIREENNITIQECFLDIKRIPRQYQKIIDFWDAMIKEKILSLYNIVDDISLAYMIASFPMNKGLKENSPLSPDDKDDLILCIENVLEHFQKIGINYPSHILEKNILSAIKQNKATYKTIRDFLQEFRRAYEYEMKSLSCFIIPSNKTIYLEPNKIFDQSILDKFPKISYEVEESQQCFALDRHSACVFHLMRILEVGLNEMAKKFAVDFTNTNWQNVIDQIEKAAKNISSSSHGNNWKNIQHDYSEICTHFRFLKDAWRNYAMHIHEQYNEERAMKIMDNVSSFMKDLAALI